MLKPQPALLVDNWNWQNPTQLLLRTEAVKKIQGE